MFEYHQTPNLSLHSLLASNKTQHVLIDDDRLKLQRTSFDYSLTIDNVTIDDEGIYTCEINTYPTQNAIVHLYLLVPFIKGSLIILLLCNPNFGASFYSILKL